MEEIIALDGSYLEGGGQILRTALALSALTRKPFSIDGIRKGRPEPGLKNQHLYCIEAMKELCNAKVEDVHVGSESIRFFPGIIKPKMMNINIETAGSVTLVLQSLLIPCILSPGRTRIRMIGGTDVKWSMPIDYLMEVLLPQLKRYAGIEVLLGKRGYYPKGGGIVEVSVKPKYSFEEREQANPIELTEQGKIVHIKGISHASSDLQDAKVAERQAMSAESTLRKLGFPVSIENQYHNTLSTGSGITLWAIFSREKDFDMIHHIRLGADSLGEKGKRAEEVGREAAERLIDEISFKAPVDEHLADNLIPYLALMGKGGRIRATKISNHTLTNIYVVEKFLDVKFDVDEKSKAISCKAVSLRG